MRIVHVTAGLIRIPVEHGGGVENYVWNVSKSLVRIGQEITILDNKYHPGLQQDERLDGVRIVRLESRILGFDCHGPLDRLCSFGEVVTSILNQILFGLRAKKYLEEHDSEFEIIHVHPLFVALLLSAIGDKGKMIYTSHINTWTLAKPSVADRLGFVLESWLIRRVRIPSVLSGIVREKMAVKAGLSPDSIAVVPVGTDPLFFKPSSGEEVAKRQESGAGPLVLFVGRIVPAKGIQYLVGAANILINHRGLKDLVFLFIGPGKSFSSKGNYDSPYMRHIRDMIDSFGLANNVRMTGSLSVNDLRDYYRHCAIFALPSIAESSPQATLEAMACAKPVVGTRVGGIPEQVRDGWNGYVVEAGNEKLLADKIEHLLKAPGLAASFGANSRMLIEKEFNWDKIALEFYTLYQAVLEKSPGN